ncbi:MAG: TIGR00269 family protein [Nanoarchaeota archaeon]|nr:TIGR00269 family protein [Nanoarchaeota archaeon]
MSCSKCQNSAVIALQHGGLCKNHFIDYFEEKVFKTINKYQLIGRNEKLCVAVSGGKDSLTVLYLTKKYLEKNNLPTNNLIALAVDEGIDNYREKTLVDLKKFCQEHAVPLTIVSFEQELGKTLDKAYPIINKDTNKRPCNVCGVWRRYLLNKHAKKLGADKVITGHNLDDEAQAIIMNMFKANTKLAGRLGPISGLEEHDLFVQRVKPLYFCAEKEVRLYALLQKFQIEFTECPYSKEGYRHHIQEMLNDFEQKYKGTKQGIVNSFLTMLPLLKDQENQTAETKIRSCSKCQEASNKDICNACVMKETIQNA